MYDEATDGIMKSLVKVSTVVMHINVYLSVCKGITKRLIKVSANVLRYTMNLRQGPVCIFSDDKSSEMANFVFIGDVSRKKYASVMIIILCYD
jgi:hypothetical protein